MVALITGGTRGIGAAITRALLGEGYTCVAAARHEGEELSPLFSEYGDRLCFFPCDISSEQSRKDVFAFIKEKFGGLDLLVNDAGAAPRVRKDMLEIDGDDFDYLMNINLKGTFFMSQLAARMMAEAESGRIVNICSVSAYAASVNRAEYCISKAGIAMTTSLFAARLAEYNIGVFEIRPGIIETDMTSSVKEKYEAMIENGLTPVRRMGQPEDVAKCVRAVARGDLDFCTGTVINADGGFSIRRL